MQNDYFAFLFFNPFHVACCNPDGVPVGSWLRVECSIDSMTPGSSLMMYRFGWFVLSQSMSAFSSLFNSENFVFTIDRYRFHLYRIQKVNIDFVQEQKSQMRAWPECEGKGQMWAWPAHEQKGQTWSQPAHKQKGQMWSWPARE